MKKYLTLFFILVIMLVVNVGFARAKDNQGLDTTREQARARMESLGANIKNEKDTVKAKVKELRLKGREMALERFDKAVARISALKDRVGTEIEKLDAKGLDITEAKSFIATAETKLTDAKDKIAEINTLLAGSIDKLSLADKTKLRTLVQEAQTLIKEAHSVLQNAVKSLKDSLATEKTKE